MTTTVDKINNLASRITELNDKHLMLHDALTVLYTDLRKLQRQEDAKPASPEPLECWVNLDAYGCWLDIHKTVEEAEDSRGCATAHLREVTPQDEQDRKDAARYRFYKTHSNVKALRLPKPYSVDFNKIIDKAMEDQ